MSVVVDVLSVVTITVGATMVLTDTQALTVDFRSASDATLSAMCDDLRAAAARVSSEGGVAIDLQEVVYFPPCAFDARLVDAVEQGARALGHPVRRLASGAGHDAVYVARTFPTAMIFVPCDDGISHNEIENAQPEHIAAGADVLLRAVLEVAQR